jgi:LysR family transcriptional regulator, glycine cleavage system transcriptional activator
MTMNIPRRLLPSLPALSAFEAAARTGSVTAAAQELNLTQSAVSRQIKLLEEQLEIVLFRRERQTIRLTAAGQAYVREIREGLRRIGAASLNLRANPAGGTLNLAVLPTFGTKWLVPRLPGFIGVNPGVVINLFTRLSRFDFRAEAIDAAIHFGDNDWSSAESVLLRPEDVVPACTPELKRKYAFKQAEDLREAPLLHLTTRPDLWAHWLSQHSATAQAVHGMLFDQLATVAAAAAAGLGVALLPIFLFEEELKCGRLVRALDLPMRMSAHYYLVWPSDRATYPPLIAFRQWLVETMLAERD